MRYLIHALLLGGVLVMASVHLNAQVFEGKVVDQELHRLPKAELRWLDESTWHVADDSGRFAIPLPASGADTARLAVRFELLVDTFLIDDVDALWTLKMSAGFEWKEVTVLDQKTGAYISSMQVFKTEIINRGELRKAACCDLAGCFETQSTVQPQVTNVITNAKELRVLGLSGVYNQLLMDGMPTFNGLSYTYGLAHVPGSMIENIWVVKGANSVLQGHEGMVGQITVWPREGSLAEAITADALVNSFGEKHWNAAIAGQIKQWSTYSAFHVSLPGARWDRDGDRFLDLPLLERYMGYTKWRYRKENENGFSAFFSLRATKDHRLGGQVDFDEEQHKGSTLRYGQVVDIVQFDAISKVGWRWRDHHKISWYNAVQRHNQRSTFGVLRYNPQQRWFNSIAQYELFYGQTRQNDLKVGCSARRLDLVEDIAFLSDTVQRHYDGRYVQEEREWGLFAENTKKWGADTWAWITGLRWDWLEGSRSFLTPRSMLRWNPRPMWDLRLSAGYGWRNVRLFSENINILTSNRDVVFAESIRPEEAWNSGVSATYKRTGDRSQLTLSADAWYTSFRNQFFPDYDRDPRQVIIQNFDQPSLSLATQWEAIMDWKNGWSMRLAYNYLDVYRMVNGQKVELPYTNRHKVLTVIGYRTRNQKWRFDHNGHWYSQPALPQTFGLEDVVAARDFWIGSLQATWVYRDWEIFGGCENISDFRLQRPIVGYQNPFGESFDTSFVWGPTRGREFYIGIRWKRKSFKKQTS